MEHKILDISNIRSQFPALNQKVYGKPLIYFDNAATTQKPKSVIDALSHYYENDNANVHRSVHLLAERATAALENTRKCVQNFINSKHVEEIIFTQGTTASINMVASSYGKGFIKPGDEILISHMEHHSNIVPWQMLCQERKAVLKVIPISDTGELGEFENLLSDRTKIVSIAYVSNTLGTINPVKEIVKKAHAYGAVVMLDAAQAAPHLPIDVQDLDCDFLAFSAHKAYGPTGVGILYGKKSLLEKMPPYQGGGEMVRNVTFEITSYGDIPFKFEAGTPNIANIIAFKEALNFISGIGQDNILKYEESLLDCAASELCRIKGLKIIGNPSRKVSIISFVLEGMHSLDANLMLDAQGIAVRSGNGCTQPLMERLGIEGVVRASMAVYNTKEEIICFAEAIEKLLNKKTK